MDNFQEKPTSQIGKHSPEMLLQEEAVAYFRSHRGFQRLFDGWVEKYQGLGRLGGIVTLDKVSNEERTTLEAFLRRRLPADVIRLSANQFKQALTETRFGDLDPLALLTAWHGGGLITKEERREKCERARQTAFDQWMKEFSHPNCQLWLKAALGKEPNTFRAQRAFLNVREFSTPMATVLRALADLPETYQRLPVFAQNVCGDPHGLDDNRIAGKLFLEALRYLRMDVNSNRLGDSYETHLSAVEELNELLYHFKLLRDDLLNFATCFGFAAYTDGREITYWQEASEVGAPLNAPLREIVRVTALAPYNGSNGLRLGNDGFKVFIVENSNVFSTLLDQCVSCHPLLVCLHGQFKLASWALLDRLIQSGATLYYSGDFDPEGLQMAEKLLIRYPGKVHLWRMTKADYIQAMPLMTLDEARLGKLKSVTTRELEPLVGAISEQGLAAYQEGILDWLIQDLRMSFSSGLRDRFQCE